MFMPENSFDLVQIGVNFQSGNEGKVTIKRSKRCNMNYGHHLRANTLYAFADFIYGNCFTKKSKLIKKA